MRKVRKIAKGVRRETAIEHNEKGKMCRFYGNINHSYAPWDCPEEPEGTIPVEYGQCPECGRRLKLKIVFGHDHELYRELPRHKRKGWWKKPKHGSRINSLNLFKEQKK